MVLESPELVTQLRATFASDKKELSRRTGWEVEVDLVGGSIKHPFGAIDIPKVGLAAQELIVVGGLENWVKSKI